MYLAEVPWCKASVTHLILRQKNRVEEVLQPCTGHGVQITTHHRPSRKDGKVGYYTSG